MRNKIYRYAIGGYRIYVCKVKHQPHCVFNVAHIQDLLAKSSGNSSTARNPQNVIRHHVLPGFGHTLGSAHLTTEPPLTLLQAFSLSFLCRELALETALLQYELNDFQREVTEGETKDGVPTLDWGVKGFSRGQLAAITTITLSSHTPLAFFPSLKAWGIREPPIRATFPSLKLLNLRVFTLPRPALWMAELSYWAEHLHRNGGGEQKGLDEGLEIVLEANCGARNDQVCKAGVKVEGKCRYYWLGEEEDPGIW